MKVVFCKVFYRLFSYIYVFLCMCHSFMGEFSDVCLLLIFINTSTIVKYFLRAHRQKYTAPIKNVKQQIEKHTKQIPTKISRPHARNCDQAPHGQSRARL